MANRDTGETKRIYPQVGRCGPILLPGTQTTDLAVLRCVMINAFNFTLVIDKSSAGQKRHLAPILSRVPGQALDPSGRMRVGPPSMPAHIALKGIEKWSGLGQGS